MKREKFGSRIGFILISAGCAIGLGNVWRFPYITGQYGGAAFVLIYLCCLVLLGFPISWYTAPTIINTFLESHDFAGKTIILFATSGGSGFGNTAQDLKRSVASSAVIREGCLLNDRLQKSAIREWLSELGI